MRPAGRCELSELRMGVSFPLSGGDAPPLHRLSAVPLPQRGGFYRPAMTLILMASPVTALPPQLVPTPPVLTPVQ